MQKKYWSYDRERGWEIRKRTSKTRTCPQCGLPAARVRRRNIDRVLSLLKPVQRYECDAPDCGWAGNLGIDGSHGNKRLLVAGSVAVFVIIFVAGLTVLAMGL